MAKIALAVLVLMILFHTPPLMAETRLDVNQAIQMALLNNEAYLRAKKDLLKAESRITEVKASAFPQLTAGLNVMRNWELSTFVINFEGEPTRLRAGTTNNFTADLTVTQPIYDGGRVFTALSAAKLFRSLSSEQLVAAERQLKLGVVQAFWQAVMADELVRVAGETVRLAEEGLGVAEKMETQGTVSDFEVLMARVRLANVKPLYIEARSASELAHEALNSMIGLPENEPVSLEFSMDSSLYLLPDLDLDSLKESSLDRRPEVRMGRLQTGLLQKSVSLAKSGYRPSIHFSTSLQFQAQYDDDRFPRQDDWSRSLFSAIMISIPIFDSWRTPAMVTQAKLDVGQSQLSEKELEENVRLEVEQAWWNYQRARESLAAQGQAVEMAQRGTAIARLRYENGVGTQLELFESEVALAQAETIRVKAFYDLATGFAALQKALGEDILIR